MTVIRSDPRPASVTLVFACLDKKKEKKKRKENEDCEVWEKRKGKSDEYDNAGRKLRRR